MNSNYIFVWASKYGLMKWTVNRLFVWAQKLIESILIVFDKKKLLDHYLGWNNFDPTNQNDWKWKKKAPTKFMIEFRENLDYLSMDLQEQGVDLKMNFSESIW